jgi:hypothetical protein
MGFDHPVRQWFQAKQGYETPLTLWSYANPI